MTRAVKIIITILLILIYTSNVIGQSRYSNTAIATVSATIVSPTTFKQSSDSSSNKVINVSNKNLLTTNHSNYSVCKQKSSSCFSNVSTTNSIAAFIITGERNISYNVTLPSTIILTENSTSTIMTINTSITRPTSMVSNGFVGTLNSNGEDTFSVGGTVKLSAIQNTGVYTGTINVTVAYN